MPATDQVVHSGRYSLIPRTLVFLTRQEHVLLLKGAPDKRLWAGLYNGVGGHVERHEDVLSAARRELIEETGLNIQNIWLCGIITVDAGSSDTGIAIYVLRGECDQQSLTPSTEGTLQWVHFDNIHTLPLVEDLHTLLPRLLVMRSGDPPFSAHYSYDENDGLIICFG